MAQETGAELLDYEQVSVPEALAGMTGGRGPDKCIDAVGMEAHHAAGALHAYDRTKQAVGLETDRPHVLREAVTSCANGGIVSVIGVYGGFADKFPMGSFMNRYLTMRAGQCHVHRYMPRLLQHIRNGDIDRRSSSPTGCRSTTRRRATARDAPARRRPRTVVAPAGRAVTVVSPLGCRCATAAPV